MSTNSEVIILDFETTGLSAEYERVIEVGAAVVKDNKITDFFSALCHPGFNVPYFITGITGITSSMLKGKPKPEKIMPKLREFIADRPIIAHNASFDAQFLHAEMSRANLTVDNPTLCTLLLARRLIQDARDYKLGTLMQHIKYKAQKGHKAHRALDDVKVTAALWVHLRRIVEQQTKSKKFDLGLYKKIAKMPKKQVASKLEKWAVRNSLPHSA